MKKSFKRPVVTMYFKLPSGLGKKPHTWNMISCSMNEPDKVTHSSNVHNAYTAAAKRMYCNPSFKTAVIFNTHDRIVYVVHRKDFDLTFTSAN
jgi:hypothetical protein